MDYISLGIKIKKSRLEKNLTQEALAELAKISTPYMGQIERGEKRLSLENFVNIANALNCSTDELLRQSMENNNVAQLSEIKQILQNVSSKEAEKITEILKILYSK